MKSSESTAAQSEYGGAEFRLSDEQCDFIAASSLVFALSGVSGTPPDVSPRGDAPGFVRVVDGKFLRLPDRIGNNRTDTIRNAILDPRITFVFLKVGGNAVLVVDGSAVSRTDPGILSEFAVNGRAPRSVMEIEVHSAKFGASKGLDLSHLWNPHPNQKGADFSFGAALALQVGRGADVRANERQSAIRKKTHLY